MSPKQTVVVENKALRHFAKKYGFHANAADLSQMVFDVLYAMDRESAMRTRAVNCGEYDMGLKYRDGQWFVTDINMRAQEEKNHE